MISEVIGEIHREIILYFMGFDLLNTEDSIFIHKSVVK